MYISDDHRIFVHTSLVLDKFYRSREILFFSDFRLPEGKKRLRLDSDYEPSFEGTEFYVVSASNPPFV
jgi:hypothetical protein